MNNLITKKGVILKQRLGNILDKLPNLVIMEEETKVPYLCG
jgi:hypothetical protein